MAPIHRLLALALLTLAVSAVSAQDAQMRSRDDGDDPRPEEGNISGNHIDYHMNITDLVSAHHEVQGGSGGDGVNSDPEEAIPISRPATTRGTGLTAVEIDIYPNPATRFLHVDLGESLDARVSLLTLLGREVYTSRQESRELQIDVTGFQPGIYFVLIQTGGERLVRKVKLNP